MKNLLAVLVLCGTFFLASPSSFAACGCAAKLNLCLTKVGATVQGCSDAFDACTEKCSDKKECVKDCRKAKPGLRQACLDAFDDKRCKAGVKGIKCRLAAKHERNKCVILSSTNNCKKQCRE